MIYLDNAATSFPKPRTVCDEVHKCLRLYCGNPGRGAHALSMAASRQVFACREAAARLLGVASPENVVFTLNTTHALNTAIKGLLRPGDHVIISDLEHNSVWRPIFAMAERGEVEYDIFRSYTGDARRSEVRICASIARLLRPNTRMVVCLHASNICSAVLPIERIAAFCHRHRLLLVVDAAQSAGHLPLDTTQMGIDVLCAPGHKGLLGPPGCGILALRDGLTPGTLLEGGNGINSLEGRMSEAPPERYEAGTLPLPAIAGLLRGLQAVEQHGVAAIHAHETALYRALLERLSSLPSVKLYAPEHVGSVLLFNIGDLPSDQVARHLDSRGICVRSGFHCAPLAHKTLCTPEHGAVRVSLGLYNTLADIDALYSAARDIIKS